MVSRLSRASVFIVQVAPLDGVVTAATVGAARDGRGEEELLYRTVFAGSGMQCFVPKEFVTSGPVAVRVREEVIVQEGRPGDPHTKNLVTSAWAAPCIVPALGGVEGGGGGGGG